MERKLKIKAGNISHLTDARYFAAFNVNWMGFNFRKNDPNALQLSDAKTIQNWISGPTIVAEFDGLDIDYIFQVCNQLQTNRIQLPEQAALQSLPDYRLIIACNNLINNRSLSNITLQFPMNSKEQVSEVLSNYPTTIFTVHNNLDLTKQIIEETSLQAIEVSGSTESEVGVKSFDAINDLFEWMENEDLIE